MRIITGKENYPSVSTSEGILKGKSGVNRIAAASLELLVSTVSVRRPGKCSSRSGITRL